MKGEGCSNLQQLAKVVIDNAVYPNKTMLAKRSAFVEHAETFHREACIPFNADHGGVILMSAHQPNLFPYSGVVRKLVLVHAVAEQLRNTLNSPVMELFCFADQDFADERYFREAQLPSVRGKNGTLELRLAVPSTYGKKLMRAVPKPDEAQIKRLKDQIERWVRESTESIIKHCRQLGLHAPEIVLDTRATFELIDQASEKSANMADFNSFFLAYLAQEYSLDTIFARFSQCQQVFSEEITFILEHFDLYARLMAQPYNQSVPTTPAPIWYHCPCDGKADVKLIPTPHTGLIATCRACQATVGFKGDLGSALKQMLPDISLRAEALLLAFSGIGITYYVGGKGGVEYLRRANRVADGLRMPFPVVSIWRPQDVYGGIGQLDAILELLRIRAEYNLANDERTCNTDVLNSELNDLLLDIDQAISSLEKLKANIASRKVDGFKETIGVIVQIQHQLKAQLDRSKIARDRSIVNNVAKTLRVMPSILDYTINIGLERTAAQWMDTLQSNRPFEADIPLTTNASSDELFGTVKQLCGGDLFE
ncbi:MAG: hypothetical protein LUP95_05435 [Euryarchaeota archaeon]|nr:hypothetical protein [Euryarchaeota archaeon]